jgi:hypothetical protein
MRREGMEDKARDEEAKSSSRGMKRERRERGRTDNGGRDNVGGRREGEPTCLCCLSE